MRKAFMCCYLATPGAVGIARKAAELAVLGWGVHRGTADDVGLVVSELLTNAVRACPHTEVRVAVEWSAPDAVTVEVWDSSPRRPVERRPAGIDEGGPDDPGGRGLGIVQALARHCGSRPDGNGKTVFAVIGVGGPVR
ncbi:ATP-binding protein [Spirillospora sp. NPDC047279]|uniref:ATP-binding protein n=1 Tax=Spirillospora sp. NPDC047279 TaxID=3155478 RepID=UPI0033D1E621